MLKKPGFIILRISNIRRTACVAMQAQKIQDRSIFRISNRQRSLHGDLRSKTPGPLTKNKTSVGGQPAWRCISENPGPFMCHVLDRRRQACVAMHAQKTRLLGRSGNTLECCLFSHRGGKNHWSVAHFQTGDSHKHKKHRTGTHVQTAEAKNHWGVAHLQTGEAKTIGALFIFKQETQ